MGLAPRIENIENGTTGPLSFRNKIINGAMNVNQRNTTVTATGYTLDRWKYDSNVSSRVSIASATSNLTGFSSALQITSSGANTPASSDYQFLSQYIEGQNVADLAWGTSSAKTITISFWVKSSISGLFGGNLRNGGNTRNYPFTFTINSSNTWEKKSIVISGDTSGTWATDTSTGLMLSFNIGNGSNFLGTAGAWTSSNIAGPSGVVNIAATNGATFYITGVQLEAGSTATAFEQRPYGMELSLCQRYYFSTLYGATAGIVGSFGAVASGNNSIGGIRFPVPMRAIPTTSSISEALGATPNTFRVTSTGATASFTPNGLGNAGFGGFSYMSTATTPLTPGTFYDFDFTNSAEL